MISYDNSINHETFSDAAVQKICVTVHGTLKLEIGNLAFMLVTTQVDRLKAEDC